MVKIIEKIEKMASTGLARLGLSAAVGGGLVLVLTSYFTREPAVTPSQQSQTTPIQTKTPTLFPNILQAPFPNYNAYGPILSISEHSFGARSRDAPNGAFPFNYQVLRLEVEGEYEGPGGPKEELDVLIPYPSSYRKGDIAFIQCNIVPGEGIISLDDIATLSNADSVQQGVVRAPCIVPVPPY